MEQEKLPPALPSPGKYIPVEESYETWEERHKNKCKERITMILSSILPHFEGIAFDGKLGTQKGKIIGKYLIDT